MEILPRSQDVIREELEFWYSTAQEDKSRSDGISHFKVSKRNFFKLHSDEMINVLR